MLDSLNSVGIHAIMNDFRFQLKLFRLALNQHGVCLSHYVLRLLFSEAKLRVIVHGLPRMDTESAELTANSANFSG